MHFNFVLLDRRRLEPMLGLEQLHTMVDSRSADVGGGGLYQWGGT